MEGSLKNKFPGHTSPLDVGLKVMGETRGMFRYEAQRLIEGWDKGPMTAQIFGNAGIEYMEKYGAKPEHFAEIARINHAHRLIPLSYPFFRFVTLFRIQSLLLSLSLSVHTRRSCFVSDNDQILMILVSTTLIPNSTMFTLWNKSSRHQSNISS
jgi:sterol carrier protein 2